MSRILTLLLVGIILTSAPTARAKAFLKTESDTDLSDMLATLLGAEHPAAAGLSEAVRDQHAKDAHAENQGALKSMFASLPKNEDGNLALPAARYALHRLFEQRYRWFVRGLHPKLNSTAGIVGKALHAMADVEHKGMSLPALAALAGTLDALIQREVAEQLAGFYETFEQSVFEAIPGSVLKQVVDAYMIVYISGSDFTKHGMSEIVADNDFMQKHTKDWGETERWIGKTVSGAAKEDESCKNVSLDVKDCRFSFVDATRIAKRVLEAYGFFNDRQCHKLKTKLLNIGERHAGRVKLSSFYKAGLTGAWEFNEKIDYLRDLGALDESAKEDPKVIVANYVSSWVNCLSESKYYSVCCRNECEDYMMVMEEHIAGPSAHPDKIIQIVETQPAFAQDQPPDFSLLRRRLVDIGRRHHGKVPIHGRLFAQWMHHAFPQTCPFPHEFGKTNPQTPDEWMAEKGHASISASDEEVQLVCNHPKAMVVNQNHEETIPTTRAGALHQKKREELPWSDVEELLVVRPTKPPKVGMSFLDKAIAFMEVAMVVAVVCSVMWIASSWRQLRMSRSKIDKY